MRAAGAESDRASFGRHYGIVIVIYEFITRRFSLTVGGVGFFPGRLLMMITLYCDLSLGLFSV